MNKVVPARHGERTWNKETLFTGGSAVDLSEKGDRDLVVHHGPFAVIPAQTGIQKLKKLRTPASNDLILSDSRRWPAFIGLRSHR